MERSVTLLPDPDSPSSAKTCPERSAKLTAVTARTIPSRVANSTLRSRMLRSGRAVAPGGVVIAERSPWGRLCGASAVPGPGDALTDSWAAHGDDAAHESGDPKRGAVPSSSRPIREISSTGSEAEDPGGRAARRRAC